VSILFVLIAFVGIIATAIGSILFGEGIERDPHQNYTVSVLLVVFGAGASFAAVTVAAFT